MSAPPWVLFCEAERDADTVKVLIDELLRLEGADWVRELFDAYPEQVRSWLDDSGASPPRAWFDLHQCYAIAARLGVRLHQGHFGERPQGPGSLLLDTVFRIVRRLHRDAPSTASRPRAVVVLWDADDQPEERREGFARVLENGTRPPVGVELVVVLAVPEREAWVAAGFVAANDRDRGALESIRSELGFAPHEHPERLTSRNVTDKRDAKRVLTALTADDAERKAQCLRLPDEATLSMLKSRGRACGLADFFEQVEAKLVPQVDPTAPSRMRRQTR